MKNKKNKKEEEGSLLNEGFLCRKFQNFVTLIFEWEPVLCD